MPDGDVGSATTHPAANSPAESDKNTTRPDAAKPATPTPKDPTPRQPRRRGGRVIGATRANGEPADPTPAHGAPQPPAPAAPARTRSRKPTAAPTAGPGVFDDVAQAQRDESTNGNGATPPAPSRRPSMSARLGTVPDVPREGEGPVVVRPQGPSEPPPAAVPTAAPVTDPTEALLLVPEVLPPSTPASTPRIAPVIPEIVPATQPEVTAPPPVVEPEAALYDLADDDPSLMIEAPVRVRRRRPRVRRVTRVVRTVDTWSVFKVAVLFAAVLYISGLLSGVLLWNVAYATGTIDNAERFMESFGWQTFEFHGGEIFHDAWIIGMFAAAGLVGLTVLAAATFNLVSDLVGGVRVTVLEEEMVVRPVTRRRKQRIRKAPPRAATTSHALAHEPPIDPGTGLALPVD